MTSFPLTVGDLRTLDFYTKEGTQLAASICGKVNSHDALVEAAKDALAGWQYIRRFHGDLPGIGWDRVENELEAVLAAAGVAS